MLAELDRSRLAVMRDAGTHRVGVTVRFNQPVDEILALAAIPIPRKGLWPDASFDWKAEPLPAPAVESARLWVMWGAAHGYAPAEVWESLDALATEARKWVRRGLPELFEAASRDVAEGRLPADLAPFLEGIEFSRGDYDNVPDFPGLAAWTLLRALDHRPFVVSDCELCGVPWLAASDEARYCHRLAPGSWNLTCLEAGRIRDHRQRKRKTKKGGKDG